MKKKKSVLKADKRPRSLTARPHDLDTPNIRETSFNATTQMDYGDMNLEDAKESGYSDKEGRAVSKAKKDKIGSPTGAYTDIGVGRSSAVRPERRPK